MKTAPTPAPNSDTCTNSASQAKSSAPNVLQLPQQGPLDLKSTAVREPEFARYWFTYRGREFRMFKRGSGPKAKWYLYFEHQKRRYNHCCGEVEKRAAEETAKIKIDAVLDGHKEVLKRSMMAHGPAVYCTIGKLIAEYEKLPLDISEGTMHGYVNCFRLVLTKALGKDVDVDQLPATVLNEETGQKFFEKAVRESKKQPDQESAARVKRSANSIFNQARCLLRPKVLAMYARAGLAVPAVDRFVAVYEEEQFSGVTAVYDPPSEKVIRKTLHEWLKLTDRNMFIAIGLELSCGLRKAEVMQTRWSMWSRSNRTALLDGRKVNVKNQTGNFSVVPIDPFWKLLNRRIDREQWRGKEDELVLQGSKTDLEDNIFRNVGSWLRGLGWETQKTNHALRAYSGSLVAMKHDIYRASAWLRHRSVKTTEQHYMHFLNGRVFEPEDVLIRWAK